MTAASRPTCFLFDNGSLRASATLSLRELARALKERLRVPVEPVSLLHSSGIDAAELGGTPARLLEPALLEAGRAGLREAVIVPLFFGPSAALTEYVPARLQALARLAPALQVRPAGWLVQDHDDSAALVAAMLARAVETVLVEQALSKPHVVLTDHGSPQAAVAAVRDRLGRELAKLLDDRVASVGVASMERRPGDAYRFNEPLLADALRQPPTNEGDVVVALQFLQAGRHAGPEGDIAQICAAAMQEQPRLRVTMTQPLVRDERLLDLLARRYEEALRSDASAR